MKACQKTVHWNANYDRENNDNKNALRPRRFKWCDVFDKFHMILFHMLDYFYLSGYFANTTLIKYASSYEVFIQGL